MEYGLGIELYEIQKSFIAKATDVIACSGVGIFSSPTGTGKTLSLLCSIYKHLESPHVADLAGLSEENIRFSEILFGHAERKTTVFYSSRTHTQLQQAMSELRKLAKNVNATVVGARKGFCINSDVNAKDADVDEVNEKCKDLVEKAKCSYYENTSVDKMHGVADIEELLSAGRKGHMCPFFLAREYAQNCEIVFLPYSLLFSKIGRMSANIDISNAIIIVDEAHNIYETVVSLNTVTVYHAVLKKYLHAFDRFKTRHGARIGDRCLEKIGFLVSVFTSLCLFFDNHCFAEKADCEDAQEGVMTVCDFLCKTGLENHNFLDLDEYVRESRIVEKLESMDATLHFQMYSVVHFILLLTFSDENGRIFYSRGKIRFTPLDPKIYFNEVLECKALLLAGGTMEPCDNLLRVFSGRKCEYFSFGTICTNFEAFILSSGPSRKEMRLSFENRDGLMKEVCSTILNLSNTVKRGGIVCFVPSKSFLQMIKATDFNFGKQVFYDDTAFFDSDMDTKPVILVSVLGGKLSEGINFSDKLCRLLLVVGVPYPAMSTEIKERMKYSGNEYSTIVAMKTVNQAIGRALRHSQDFAAIVLIDTRYNALISKISPWVRPKLRSLDFPKTFIAVRDFLVRNNR